jgi:hypothetical protein
MLRNTIIKFTVDTAHISKNCKHETNLKKWVPGVAMKAKVGDEKGGSEESEVRGLERRRGIFVLIERKSAIFLVLGVSLFALPVACLRGSFG